MKKLYIQPTATIFDIEINNICAGSQNLPIGDGSLTGSEEGFTKGASASRYSDWSDYER